METEGRFSVGVGGLTTTAERVPQKLFIIEQPPGRLVM